MSLERLNLPMVPKPGDRTEGTQSKQHRSEGGKGSPFELIVEGGIEEGPPRGAGNAARDASGGTGPRANSPEPATRTRGDRLAQTLDTLGEILAEDPVLEGLPGETGKSQSRVATLQPIVTVVDAFAEPFDGRDGMGEGTGFAEPIALHGTQLPAREPPVRQPASADPPFHGESTAARANKDEPSVGEVTNGKVADMKSADDGTIHNASSGAADTATTLRQLPGMETVSMRAAMSRPVDKLSTREVAGSLQSMTVTRRETHFTIDTIRALPARTLGASLDQDVASAARTMADIDPEVRLPGSEITPKAQESKLQNAAVETFRPLESGSMHLDEYEPLQPSTMRVFEAISAKLNAQQVTGHQAASGPATPSVLPNPAASGGPLKILGLQLEPDALGKVNVELTMKDGALNVLLRAETGIAARQIEQDKAALGKALEVQGYRVEDIVLVRAELEPGRHQAGTVARGFDHANMGGFSGSERFASGAEANSDRQTGRQTASGFDEQTRRDRAQSGAGDDASASDRLVHSGLII